MSLLIEGSSKAFTSSYNTDFTIIRSMPHSKFPLYLAKTPLTSKLCVVKVFPFEEGHVSSHYIRETSIADLSHTNIIGILRQRGLMKTCTFGGATCVSYIIMEYAPYGDFYDFITASKLPIDDRLARTYFRQLIDGLEYLHSKGIYHLDLKPENLLLGENFQLKIADFDLCHSSNDDKILTHGTRFYRAPELANQNCSNPSSADIFSAGIFLFNLKTGGFLPQFEDTFSGEINLFDAMQMQPELFWEWHAKTQEMDTSECFDKNFRDLFLWTTKLNPEERPTIQQIKETEWYNGPIYEQEELKELFSKYIS